MKCLLLAALMSSCGVTIKDDLPEKIEIVHKVDVEELCENEGTELEREECVQKYTDIISGLNGE